MWPDRVSNPRPLTYESGALPTAPLGPAGGQVNKADNRCLFTQLPGKWAVHPAAVQITFIYPAEIN